MAIREQINEMKCRVVIVFFLGDPLISFIEETRLESCPTGGTLLESNQKQTTTRQRAKDRPKTVTP
jgi:hypothetical protein